MADERILVTGGTGCIGAWVVRNLLHDGVPFVVVTVDQEFGRLKLILTEAEFARITFVSGDISDIATLETAAKGHRINRIIHLAGMQLPLCAADPIKGALVNVAGTVTIFELARRLGIELVVYASSAAVYGPSSRYQDSVLGPYAPFFPTSHYGVYKVANEWSARVYWQNDGVSSIGLRPHSVYGPGRDQGVTSKPTLAIIAAAVKRPYHINFNGRYQFQFADDVARAFIRAARSPFHGQAVYNLGGSVFGVDEIIASIETNEPDARGRITFDDRPLAFPAAFEGRSIVEALGEWSETPLEEGVRRTLDCYRAALLNGTIDTPFLDRVLA